MAAIIFHEPVFATVVESGDKLYFYDVGTTDDYTVYTDFALSAAATQPVVADSNGRFVPLYIDGTGADFKVVLHDSDDVEKWTCDRYPIDDLTSLTATVATNSSDITTLQGSLTTAEGEIDTLQTESADYETRITDLEGATSPLTSSDFSDNQSLVTNGYADLPGGRIEQWATQTSAGTYSWPKAFPTACLNVVVSLQSVSAAATNTHVGCSCTSTQYTITQGADVGSTPKFVRGIGY